MKVFFLIAIPVISIISVIIWKKYNLGGKWYYPYVAIINCISFIWFGLIRG